MPNGCSAFLHQLFQLTDQLADFLGQLVNQVSDSNNYDQESQDNND